MYALPRDLKRYLARVCVFAAVLLVIGVWALYAQSRDDRARDEQVYLNAINELATSIESAINKARLDAPGDTNAVRRALCAWSGGANVKRPLGAFTWAPRSVKPPRARDFTATNLVWAAGLPDAQGAARAFPTDLAAALAPLMFWQDWTAVGTKGAAKRGLMERAPYTLLWRRLGDELHGLVFEGWPLARSATQWRTWLLYGVFAGVTLCLIGLGAWPLVNAASTARENDRVKSEFLSICSHELKTPLAAIRIWIDLLQGGRLRTDAKREEAYATIARENERMTRLIENLLNLARIEQRRLRYEIARVDLTALAAEAVALVRGDFPAHGVAFEPPADAVVVLADADAVRQILVNLLGNAAKYAAAGGPVDVVVETAEGRARLAVRDRGPGLAPEQRARIFERFYRTPEAIESRAHGLGIGLALSRTLARDLHGDLTVAPRPGGGCAFTLDLPLA